MNTLIRGLGLGVVLSAALIMSGCSTDNETAASKEAGAGNVPAPEKGTTKDGVVQAKSYDDYAKQQQSGGMYSGGGYPGAPGGAAAKGGEPAPAPATKK
ncbi:MAG: hypothetical protein ACYC61_00075 [Isosphaeraceae bacterium]